MPDSLVFPYGITLHEEGRIALYPAARVGFLNKEKEWIFYFLIIDSGATISAMPESDTAIFGIDAKRGLPIVISGIDGRALNGWQHTLSVRIGKEIVDVPIVFLENDLSPRVLGRAGIFERFTIIFEENRHRSGFLGTKSREARSVKKLLDTIIKK